jgi:phage-related minor tail protein/Ca2+-binding EF-hand superfamily protein
MVDVVLKLRVDGAVTSQQAVQQVTAALQQQGVQVSQVAPAARAASQATAEHAKAMSTGAISANQYAAALRNVPAQFTDIVTQLQGGANPLTVLMQQGGQLKDMFGGVGTAARALGGYVVGLVNPFTAVAAAVGAVGIAAYQGSREMDGYRTALTLTGNSLGVTAGQMNSMAASISATGKATQGAASEALVEMATNGKVGKDQLQAATQAALVWGKATGASAADVAKNFADLAKDPLGGTLRLNEGMNYLTASTYQQIKALTDQGRTTEAAAVAHKAYYDAMLQRTPELLAQTGYLEAGWRAVTREIAGAWSTLKNIGREQSAEDKLADKTAIIAQMRKLIESSDGERATRLKARLAILLEEQGVMQSQAREIQRGVALSAQQAEQSKAKSEADKDGLKYLTEEERLRKDIAQETQRLKDAVADPKKINDRIAAIRYKTDLGYMQARIDAAAQLRKLDDANSESSIRHQVAVEVLTQEQGIQAVAALRVKALQDQAADADRLAKATAGRDPLQSAQTAAKAAALRTEAANVQAQSLRDLTELAYKADRAVVDAANNALGAEIGRRQALEESTRAMGIQTQQARQHGIVIDSVATILDREKVALYDTALATAEKNLQDQRAQGLTAEKLKGYEDAVALLTRMRDGLKGVTAASEANDLAKAGLDQTQRLRGITDPSAPMTDFGNTLRDALGGAGSELGKMVNAMTTLNTLANQYAVEMKVIQDLRSSGDEKNIETARKNEIALVKKQEQAQIGAYATMAGAAASYFGKQTAAYKMLHGAEVALRTYQLVMSAQTAAKDLAGIAAKVTSWLAGDEAITASAVTSSATQVAASMAEGAASAAAGVANQAKGDPYTAFPRIAAMAAIMAALGFAVSGGGGGGTTYDSFAAQKANDGTGTVLGNSSAQSQSIAQSLAALESMARPELSYTSEMVRLLRNIDGSLSGTTNILLASGFDTLGSSFQGYATSHANIDIPLIGSLFGGSSSSTSLADMGLAFAQQTVAQAMQSLKVQQYAVTRTDWSDSGFFGIGGGSGTNYSTAMSDIGANVGQAMSTVLSQLTDAVTRTASQLGATSQQVQAVRDMDTGLGKVSLKGKTGDEIQKTLSAVFSALGDNMAQTLAPAYLSFQKAGEGYLQTITRLASGHEEAAYYAEKLGMATAALSAVQNKSGDVAAELLRQTLLQSTAVGSGMAKIVQDFTGSVGDLADLYTGLQSVSLTLRDMGQSASAVTTDLLRGAGGMDALKSGLDAFESGFMTASERAAAQQSRMAAEFARIGVAMPATAEQFKDLVKTIDTSTAAGQKSLGSLLSLSSGFKDLLDAQSEATQAQRDLADKWLESGKSISQWADKLATSSLGLSTPQQTLSNSRGDYLKGLSLARGNDQDALGAITGQAQSYLQAARDASASQAQYGAVLAQVRAELKSLPAVKSYESQMLDALGLINTSIKTDVIATLNDRFTSLDANVDGLLTYSELRTGLGYTDTQINALMAVVDTNGDLQLSATEIQTAALHAGVDAQINTLNDRFTSLDTNVDGLLTYSELRTGLGVTDSQIQALMDVVDTNGDGQISALEAQRAAIGGVATNTKANANAIVDMNNNTLMAVSYNTAQALDFAASQVSLLQKISDYSSIIANKPAATVVNNSGGGGLVGKVMDVLGFAQGDVFGGAGIYTQPTSFNFGTQLGALGEAGPEAIMPLERLGDGSLGVRALLPPMPPMQTMIYGNVDVLELARVLQAGMRDLAQRIDQLDDNNNAGNAAIAAATAKTAKILNNASTGDALRTEVAT